MGIFFKERKYDVHLEMWGLCLRKQFVMRESKANTQRQAEISDGERCEGTIGK